MDFDKDDIEYCPLCYALVVDLYEHLIWHGIEPLGSRFRRRYEKDPDAKARVMGRRAWRRDHPGEV